MEAARVSAAPPTLVVCGSVHYDMMLKVDRFPQDNDRISPTAVTLAPGGMGGNVATAAARLGAGVRFVGQFADNEDGRALREDLERDGVDTSFAGVRPSGERYHGTIMVDRYGQRAILGAWPDPNSLERSPGQAPGNVRDLNAKRDFARYFQEFTIAPDAFVGENVAFAAPFNYAPLTLPSVPEHVPCFFDIETAHVTGWSEDEIWSVLHRATVLYGNQRNLQELATKLDHPSVAMLSRTLNGIIVETAGELGCVVHNRGARTVVPGFQVQATDTTGAGDCFAGACTVALMRGEDLLHAARFANAAAALSTLALGSRPGMPHEREVRNLLKPEETPTQEFPTTAQQLATSKGNA